MKRLDLIIDALELASHVPKGVVYPAGYPMQIAQALAAARELRGVNQELLEVLQNLCEAADNGHVASYSNLWDDAKAAITKATGELNE